MEPIYLPEVTVRWGGERVRIRPMRSHYIGSEDVTAIAADYEGEFGREPYGTVSVNLVGQPPAEGCIWVKTWSENEGLLEQLVALGVLEPTGRTVPTGWAVATEARLVGDWA